MLKFIVSVSPTLTVLQTYLVYEKYSCSGKYRMSHSRHGSIQFHLIILLDTAGKGIRRQDLGQCKLLGKIEIFCIHVNMRHGQPIL